MPDPIQPVAPEVPFVERRQKVRTPGKLSPEERAAIERRLFGMREQLRTLINSDQPDSDMESHWEEVMEENRSLQLMLKIDESECPDEASFSSRD